MVLPWEQTRLVTLYIHLFTLSLIPPQLFSVLPLGKMSHLPLCNTVMEVLLLLGASLICEGEGGSTKLFSIIKRSMRRLSRAKIQLLLVES